MRALGWLVLLVMVGVARGQQAEITPEMPVSSAVLQQWLHSGEPRLVAWAADFARRRNDVETLAEMPGVLEHWAALPVLGRADAQAEQRRAAMAVLDALIEQKTRLPVDGIRQVVEEFPVQAAILASRLPISESRGMLGDWTYGKTGGWFGPILARVAVMLLAKEPDPSLVVRVVSESEERLQVYLVAPGWGFAEGGLGGACGDSMTRRLEPGWPQIYAYDLVENDVGVSAGRLVDLDGDYVDYRRFEENRPWGTCYGVRPLNAETRHLLIAHWLGVSDRTMTWQPTERTLIEWKGRAAYTEQLGAAVEAQRRKLQATVEGLRARGLIRDDDVDGSMPRLLVTVRCELIPCPLGDGE